MRVQKTFRQDNLATEKPFSEACEHNKTPILAILNGVFDVPAHILEIGTGTGQHAVYFAAALPHLTWQTSDLPENHYGIAMWLDESVLPNLLAPIALDVTGTWPEQQFDGVFTANTLHILCWEAVDKLFQGVGLTLKPGGRLVIYGPFNYGGRFTSDSNARFDEWLKARDPNYGIRDFDAVVDCASRAGLQLTADHAMPANNRTLVFTKP